MYVLNLNPTYLALHTRSFPDSAQFSLRKLCPYMTQEIEVKMYPEAETMPVVSWQLAMQIQECRKNHPELKAFRFNALDESDGFGGGPRRIEGLDRVTPGNLLLMMANLKRGLGDMLLLLPILRAQSQHLRELGWDGRFGLSSSTGFKHLFYGQSFVDEFLPEMPGLTDVYRYDYFMEYGISLERMKSLIGIQEWEEIDLKVELKLPPEGDALGWKRFPSDNTKIFLHWESFDKQRTLPVDWFDQILREFNGAEFYCTLFGNKKTGEIFPGGPVNVWPYEKSLLDLFITLRRMDVVVTTNTGIAHVAAALGIPTIIIFSGRLYGWGDYWPRKYKALYPSMHTIGLQENLTLTPVQIQDQLIEVLHEIIPAGELVPA